MSAENQGNPSPSKKILESSPLSGIAVPIAIVLIGGLIIFGVTKMLSSGEDHRDLIDEMNSKTFGNRWVAAYELSKFVVLALGSLKNPLSIKVLSKALEDQDPQVKFNAVVSIGNLENTDGVDWSKIEAMLLQDQDAGLKQVALFALASQKRTNTSELALPLLTSSDKTLRYAAANVLIYYKKTEALPVLEEIAALKYDSKSPEDLNGAQVEGLKTNLLENIEKSEWKDLWSLVSKMESSDGNIRVQTKAKQVLKLLKN